MIELYYKESWAPKNWCFWTVVLEKTLESPLDCKEIQLVHPKGDQWVFIGRTDVEAETPILWPPDSKSWLIGKDPDAGKVWGQEEKGMAEDKMVWQHHRLNGHVFVWTPGVGDGQEGMACCSSWGGKVGHDQVIELNWTVLLRVPWTARRSNQSILKEVNPEYSLKWLLWSCSSNTLATWYKEPTHCQRSWCWERLKAKGERDGRGWNG